MGESSNQVLDKYTPGLCGCLTFMYFWPSPAKGAVLPGSAVTCLMNPKNMSHALCLCAVLLTEAPLPFVLENSSLQFPLVVW